jgi:hypothetical protein
MLDMEIYLLGKTRPTNPAVSCAPRYSVTSTGIGNDLSRRSYGVFGTGM